MFSSSIMVQTRFPHQNYRGERNLNMVKDSCSMMKEEPKEWLKDYS